MFDINRFTKVENDLVAEASTLELKPGEVLTTFTCFNAHGPGSHTSFEYAGCEETANGEIIEWVYKERGGNLKATILND